MRIRWGQLICQWRGAAIATPSVAAALIMLRLTGALQLLELTTLDCFFRLRPLEAADTRIVIVTINESDVTKVGQRPITDAILAQMIRRLKQQQPIAIGLDLYRNLPVEPGHQNSIEVFKSTPNLIGVEKVIGTYGDAVEPPPVLNQLNQVSATDFVLDADGKLRRSLLFLRDRRDRTVFSLGAKLALMYLEAKGITLQLVDAKEKRFKLGRAEFVPFQANDGGYIHAEVGGYQILSNFRKVRHGFRMVSMADVLDGRMPPDLVRNRIVLIGSMAESLGDRFSTPYSSSPSTRLTGVDVHADLASQLLDAALVGRPVFRVWPEPLEWLWILAWSGIGAMLGWVLQSPERTAISVLLAGSGLVGGAYLLFLEGWWLIVIPPALALVGSAIISTSYCLWESLKSSHKQLEGYTQTLERKVEERTQELSENNVQLQQEIRERTAMEAELRRSEEQLKASLQEKELLLKEVYHRVKNNLQVISSIFYLQSQYIKDPQVLSLLEDSQNRVRSMALVHEKLYQSKNLAKIDFANYIQNLVSDLFASYNINPNLIHLKLHISNVSLNLDAAITCGLLINELVSNSLKHAFLKQQSGEIYIIFLVDSEGISLTVRDSGIGLPPELDLRKTNSLGLRLIRALTRQLKGKLEVYNNNGAVFQITFPQPQERQRF